MVDWVLEVKAARRQELTEEIEAALVSEELEPGQAGKLKGKLMFGASQLWGKVGREFLRARRACRSLWVRSTSERVPLAVVEAHSVWTFRMIELCANKKADAVLFTDGFRPQVLEMLCSTPIG